jgi:hypothetical protein
MNAARKELTAAEVAAEERAHAEASRLRAEASGREIDNLRANLDELFARFWEKQAAHEARGEK